MKQMWARRALPVIGTILFAMVAIVGVPGSASAFGYYAPHQLIATSNGQCLTYNTDLSNVSQRLYMSQCAQAWSPQLWDINYVGNGFSEIRSRYDPTRCVDVYAFSQAQLGRVVTWTCNGFTNQQWSFTYDSSVGGWAIQARHSSECLQSLWPWVVQNNCYYLIQPRWYVTN
jgi:hypothetical protein